MKEDLKISPVGKEIHTTLDTWKQPDLVNNQSVLVIQAT